MASVIDLRNIKRAEEGNGIFHFSGSNDFKEAKDLGPTSKVGRLPRVVVPLTPKPIHLNDEFTAIDHSRRGILIQSNNWKQ